jgi:hypothetical protein
MTRAEKIDHNVDYYVAMIDRQGLRKVLRMILAMLDQARKKAGYKP